MKTLSLLSAILLILLFSNCQKEINTEYPPELLNSWVNSFEEETDNGIFIYRPSDYKVFEIRRYKGAFWFGKNNKFTYTVCSPDDAHYSKDGFWVFKSDGNEITIYNKKMEKEFEFNIVSLDKDLLKIR